MDLRLQALRGLKRNRKTRGTPVYVRLAQAMEAMNPETRIKDALQTLRSAISAADGDAMTAGLQELDRLAREERERIDPRLLHFLERRSYEKAWDFLASESGAS